MILWWNSGVTIGENNQTHTLYTYHQIDKLGLAMRKRVFRHMRTAKAQIRLRVRAIWSGPALSADRLYWYCRMYACRAKPRMVISTCAGYLNLHILRMFKGIFFVFVWYGPNSVIWLWCDFKPACLHALTATITLIVIIITLIITVLYYKYRILIQPAHLWISLSCSVHGI